MSLTPQFGVSSNWSQIYTTQKNAVIVPGDPPSHDPIPPFFVPVQFTSPTIAIYVNTENPKLTWKSGGVVSANVTTGIIRGGDSSSEIARQWLNLGDVTICRFPSVASSYSVKLFPPYWFKRFFVEIFEYVGPGKPDSEGKLDVIYNQLI